MSRASESLTWPRYESRSSLHPRRAVDDRPSPFVGLAVVALLQAPPLVGSLPRRRGKLRAAPRTPTGVARQAAPSSWKANKSSVETAMGSRGFCLPRRSTWSQRISFPFPPEWRSMVDGVVCDGEPILLEAVAFADGAVAPLAEEALAGLRRVQRERDGNEG
jgi:hypothetical protein